MASRAAPGVLREREQPAEPEEAVAADAGIGRLAALVAPDERLDDRLQEVLAGVERHMREAALVAGSPGCEHRLRRTAGALDVRPFRVEPEPERDAHRLRAGAQQGHSAVDAAAHCDGHTVGIPARAEDRPERVRERVDHELVSADRRRFEQRQADERTVESVGVRADDAVAVDAEADEPPVGAARGISDDLDHAATVAPQKTCGARPKPGTAENQGSTLPMPPRSANLDVPGGCPADPGSQARTGLELPSRVCWFTLLRDDTHRVEHLQR